MGAHMRTRPFQYGSFAVFWLWALAATAWSAAPQAAPPAAPATEQADTAPVAIAITDVIPGSERVLTRLRDIRNALEADNSVTVVGAALPEFSRQSDEWWESEGSAIQQLHSVQRVNDVEWQLRLYEGQVNAWSGLLTSSSKEWSAEKQTLGRLLADWKATQSALDKTAPIAVSSKIDEVLTVGDAVQRLFQQKTAQLVAVQDKLAARMTRLNEIGGQIEMVRLQAATDLLALDTPPLWTALSGNKFEPSYYEQVHESVMKFSRDAAGFYQLYRRRLFLHLMLVIALVVTFFRLRRLSQSSDKVTPKDLERYVFDRSFASALLVALLSVPILYSEANPQLMRMLLIPAVIPALTLLPAVFTKPFRMAFHVLTAVYIVEFWRYYLPPQWSLVRILLLVEALMGIGAIYLVHSAKTAGAAPSPSPSLEAFIRSTFKIGLGLFIGAIVANLAGDFTLAEFLVSPVVRILYMGVLIYMLAIVATTYSIMALRSKFALRFRTVQQHSSAVADTFRRLARIAAVCLWIGVAVFNIGALGFVQNALQAIFGAQWKLGAAEISLRDVVIFTLVFGIAYILSRILRFILAQEIFPRFHMPRGVPDALELLARYGVLLFGFLLALISAGVNLSQLTLALSALGVGIGFGLQNIVNNFVCGLILVFEHPIQVGDYVEVGQHSGQVQRIGFRSSSVSTGDGGTVIIPNSELIGTKVMNWSLSDQLRRVTLRIPVPFGTDPKQVVELFQAAARNHPDVVAYPAPSAALDKFGEGSLIFILRGWTKTERYESVSQSLTLAINKAFQDAGIQIPFTQSDVHLHLPEKAGSELPSVEKLNQAAAGVAASPKSTAGS